MYCVFVCVLSHLDSTHRDMMSQLSSTSTPFIAIMAA